MSDRAQPPESLPLIMPSIAAAKYYVGMELGPTEWIPITQDRINRFAEATGDRQWIHCDVERAQRESPWKTTIAHGYLTLSLVPDLLPRLIQLIGGKTAVNTGVDKCRLSAPVPSGSRVRMSAVIRSARTIPRSGVRLTFGVRFEVEGNARPALVADVNYVYFS